MRSQVRHGRRRPPILHPIAALIHCKAVSILRQKLHTRVVTTAASQGLSLTIALDVNLYLLYDSRCDLSLGAAGRLCSPLLAFGCARRLRFPKARPLALAVNGLLKTLVRVDVHVNEVDF